MWRKARKGYSYKSTCMYCIGTKLLLIKICNSVIASFLVSLPLISESETLKLKFKILNGFFFNICRHPAYASNLFFNIRVVSLNCGAYFDIFLSVITLSMLISFKVELTKVIEVRCGQQTRNFNQFPYLEVEKQSFSLMFHREQGE